MYELYNARIVHCDLKPGNILVSADGHLSIADFGISMVDTIDDPDVPFEERTFLAYGGTHAYQAPELLITHDKANITCAADMWSFGAIVYEIYTGKVRRHCSLVRREVTMTLDLFSSASSLPKSLT